MSDIDIRRQIWHLAAPIDCEGLLAESGGGGWGQILKWENNMASFNVTSMKFSRSRELSRCPGNCPELVRDTSSMLIRFWSMRFSVHRGVEFHPQSLEGCFMMMVMMPLTILMMVLITMGIRKEDAQNFVGLCSWNPGGWALSCEWPHIWKRMGSAAAQCNIVVIKKTKW